VDAVYSYTINLPPKVDLLEIFKTVVRPIHYKLIAISFKNQFTARVRHTIIDIIILSYSRTPVNLENQNSCCTYTNL